MLVGYSTIKIEDTMSFADKWMELENIILSEVIQTQKKEWKQTTSGDRRLEGPSRMHQS